MRWHKLFESSWKRLKWCRGELDSVDLHMTSTFPASAWGCNPGMCLNLSPLDKYSAPVHIEMYTAASNGKCQTSVHNINHVSNSQWYHKSWFKKLVLLSFKWSPAAYLPYYKHFGVSLEVTMHAYNPTSVHTEDPGAFVNVPALHCKSKVFVIYILLHHHCKMLH